MVSPFALHLHTMCVYLKLSLIYSYSNTILIYILSWLYLVVIDFTYQLLYVLFHPHVYNLFLLRIMPNIYLFIWHVFSWNLSLNNVFHTNIDMFIALFYIIYMICIVMHIMCIYLEVVFFFYVNIDCTLIFFLKKMWHKSCRFRGYFLLFLIILVRLI